KSFEQLVGINEEINYVVQTLKKNIIQSIFVLQGEVGTGKKTIARAFHNNKYDDKKIIWRVQIKKRLSDISLHYLVSMVHDYEGTYYVEGWELLTFPQLKYFLNQISLSFSTCFLGTINPFINDNLN